MQTAGICCLVPHGAGLTYVMCEKGRQHFGASRLADEGSAPLHQGSGQEHDTDDASPLAACLPLLPAQACCCCTAWHACISAHAEQLMHKSCALEVCGPG